MIQPLEYGTPLTYGQAEERYDQVSAAFAAVAARYSGMKGLFVRNIRPDDQRTLVDCTAVLLPLSIDASVQAAWLDANEPKHSLPSRIGQLQEQMLLFASRFRNTGVKRVQ